MTVRGHFDQSQPDFQPEGQPDFLTGVHSILKDEEQLTLNNTGGQGRGRAVKYTDPVPWSPKSPHNFWLPKHLTTSSLLLALPIT